MSGADRAREPPVYRPLALLAFATTVAGGTPLGLWMLAALYLGAPAVAVEWRLLHANLQIFGFFATLIPGIAPHLLPRFTGRPVEPTPLIPFVAGGLGLALVLRAWGTWSGSPGGCLAASILQGVVFTTFGGWVWRSLDPPPLGLLRRHLTAATAWLAAACLVEAALRWRALAMGVPVPDLGGVRAVHAMAIFGGVVGWILGVLLRAGPMFIPDWNVPPGLARALPWALAVGIALSAVGESGAGSRPARAILARLGELVALGSVAAVMVTAGAFRRAGRALPMVSRGREETRIFRLAAISIGIAAAGSALAAVSVWWNVPVPSLTDAVRHLVTVGFLTSVAVAMSFRLVPVLEGKALPWPGLRAVAFWALLAGVILRTSEVLGGPGRRGIGGLVVASGLCVWIALAAVAANVATALARSPVRAR